MKTFLYSIPNKIQSFSKKLDVKAVLCSKSWVVFNDEGVKQLFIFNEDGTILITNNGRVINASWKFIPQNSSILITAGEETLMFRPAFFNKDVLALQQDGVERYLFMIDEEKEPLFLNLSLDTLAAYIEKEVAGVSNEKEERIKQHQTEQQKEEAEKEEKEREREEITNWFIANKEQVAKRMEDKHAKGEIGMLLAGALFFLSLIFLVIHPENVKLSIIIPVIAILSIFLFLYFLVMSLKFPAEHLHTLCNKEFKFHTDFEINKIYEEL